MKESILEFHEYQRLIHSCLRLWKLPEPYEDCLQESYLIYLRCVEKYDPSRCKFSTYYFQSLYRHFQTMKRKNHRAREAARFYSIQQTSFEKDPLQEPLLLFDIHHYSSLKPIEQAIVDLSYSGYTIAEISVLLGKSPSTVKRARKQIKGKVSSGLSME